MSFILKRSLKYFLIALISALILKSFFIDAFKIPYASMENTLLVGDYILINKAYYSVSTPHYIALLNLWLTSYPLIKFKNPKKNDIIVFKFPGYSSEVIPSENTSYIKRVIGLPGDTVQIINGLVYINGRRISQPENAIFTSSILDENGSIDDRIFPGNKDWNNDNYGPLVVPKKGENVHLTPYNIAEWEILIDREFGYKAVSSEGSVITIGHKPVRDYTVKKNYYFVLGDNREDSMDSRYWGFVADDLVIGKAVIIYWSWDSFKSVNNFTDILKPIRLNRIFKIIN